jgi:hypothetical protein
MHVTRSGVRIQGRSYDSGGLFPWLGTDSQIVRARAERDSACRVRVHASAGGGERPLFCPGDQCIHASALLCSVFCFLFSLLAFLIYVIIQKESAGILKFLGSLFDNHGEESFKFKQSINFTLKRNCA